jgi:hypothetical protein
LTDVPALASRDAVFALPVGELLPRPGEFAVNLLAVGALTPHLDGRNLVADWASPPAGASGVETPVEPLTSLTSKGGQAFAAGTDSFFTDMADDAAAVE